MTDLDDPIRLAGERDTLFESRAPGPFVFDADVARVFDDMIDRSVPLYRETELTVAATVASIVPDGGTIVDLGCSTGTGTIAMALACVGRGVTVHGWDRSAEMIARAQDKAAGVPGTHFAVRDVCDTALPPVDVLTAIYTLQFTPPGRRPELLAELCRALRPGGALVWAEKMAAPDPQTQAHWDAMYDAYKLGRGYSREEIRAKRAALDGVLVPWTEPQWREALRAAGFVRVSPLLRWLPFGSFVAWTR